jgi:hypothetical protein
MIPRLAKSVLSSAFLGAWLVLATLAASACGSGSSGADDAGEDARADGGTQDDTGSGSATDTGTGLDGGPDSGLDAGASCVGFPDMTHCTLVTDPDRKYDVCVEEKCVSPGCGDAGCNVPGAHYRLPPDAVHNSFDRTTDDEAVVTDTITKLVWQGCPAGMSGPSCEAGAPATMAWEDAVYYCDGLDYHGFKDWRLPDPGEFQTIADYGRYDYAVNVTVFPGFKGPFLYWWTISGYAKDPTWVWRFEFSSGTPVVGDKDGPWGVTCVRGKAKPAKHYKKEMPVDGEPIVIDGFAGLMWQGCPIALHGEQCDQGELLPTDNWIDAKNLSCQSQDWSGYSDWRMPNIKELMTIVDTRHFDPAMDTSLFGDQNAEIWSSTVSRYGMSPAWYLDTPSGGMYGSDVYYRCVQCVRSVTVTW